MRKLFAGLVLVMSLAGCGYEEPYYGYNQQNYVYMGGWYGYYGNNHTFIHVQHMSPYQYQVLRQRQMAARVTYQRNQAYQTRMNAYNSSMIRRQSQSSLSSSSWSSRSSSSGYSYRSSGGRR